MNFSSIVRTVFPFIGKPGSKQTQVQAAACCDCCKDGCCCPNGCSEDCCCKEDCCTDATCCCK